MGDGWLRRYVIQGATLEPKPADESSAPSEESPPPPLLSLACARGDAEVVAVLLEYSADVWAVDENVRSPRTSLWLFELHSEFASSSNPRLVGWFTSCTQGGMCVHYCADSSAEDKSSVPVMRLLLEAGADCFATRYDGVDVLMLAASSGDAVRPYKEDWKAIRNQSTT